jgi:organic radical activating enzyme
MKTYKIQETFESIQGEGKYSGEFATFIRFYGCNLSCIFCDTPQNLIDERKTSLAGLISYKRRMRQLYVLTGGEPLLQVDNELLENLQLNSRKIIIETNGSLKPKFNLERFKDLLWITCSPKMVEINEELEPYIDEYKLLITEGTTIRVIEKYINTLKMVSLQPLMDSNYELNLKRTIELVSTNYRNGEAHLSLQIHKIIGVK